MGILTTVSKPVYRTTNGREFVDGSDAANEQIRISLDEMASGFRFKPNPGVGGNWSWTAVVAFIANNHEELRILLNNVQPSEANQKD